MTEHTPEQIAALIGLHTPTPEQAAVISAPLAPSLVIAGAGSGKTETMAARVLWLIANGHVRPAGVLGLTFTRKAAGELAQRIRTRTTALRNALGAGPTAERLGDEFDEATVSTYHSFAHGIFADYAALLGRDPDSTLLGEAAAWQLARSVVVGSGLPELADWDHSLETITGAVVRLAGDLGEYLADPADLVALARRFGELQALPLGGRGLFEKEMAGFAAVEHLPVLLELVERYSHAKRDRGLVEFSDQVAMALQIVRRAPQVRAELRERFPVVLLDEFQDTSVLQTALLVEVFGDTPVMAVGDPNQSIYGWRGASASNLADFASRFEVAAEHRFTLSTSWRNGHAILTAANRIAEPLASTPGGSPPVGVVTLTPSPAASELPVELRYTETIAEEADEVAYWLKKRLDAADGPAAAEARDGADAPTAAILFRSRSTQRVFIDALRRHQVRYHVVGLGGLLEEPEVADVVCALSVLDDPHAGSELIRLLAGPRWRIGAADLRRLRRLAGWLAGTDHAQQRYPQEVTARLKESVSLGDEASIVEALDFLVDAPPAHSRIQAFSEEGLARLRSAGGSFRELRRSIRLGLTELVGQVIHDFRLDIEVLANETRPLGSLSLDAFTDTVESYLALGDTATLGGFLRWLREAERRERISPPQLEPEGRVVQLLTVHAAKGLEWDVVAVPRLVQDEFPAKPRSSSAWVGFGRLPWEFRGDAAELPQFGWRSVTTRKELVDEYRSFATRVGEHYGREERRLAYVAVTRARHRLLLTGSFWGGQRRPRGPSTFLTELADAGLIAGLPDGTELIGPPEESFGDELVWPRDPLGDRRGAVEGAARLVEEAMRSGETAASAALRLERSRGGGDAGRLELRAEQIALLIADRRSRLSGITEIELPHRVPASRFKDYLADANEVAAELRRPMPERPYRATRLGTNFHRWVEDRSGLVAIPEAVDALPAEWDAAEPGAEPEAEALATLQATFERSRWAALQPIEVERELHLPFAGQTVVCKIDAVYLIDGRYEIVDWKTGKAPRTESELEERALQLALYRLAYAAYRGVSPEEVDAVFYYVADDLEIRPDELPGLTELEERWRESIA